MHNDFKLDPFQQEAIDWIRKNHSVLISAPTGAGKTLIAESAIEQAFSNQKTVIYTAPIKALSNQKYRDFRKRFGNDQVGILTGDVSLNPDAPIVIMTTEIYRNSLFDNSSRLKNLSWVIFDEIHYLDDVERGTVWEEALLFTPEKVCILALSATIPNIHQLAQWIKSIHHQRPLEVVIEDKRPVPLHMLYQCQGKIMDTPDKLYKEGYFQRNSWKISWKEKRRRIQPERAKPNRLEPLLTHLQQQKRLPMIYFVFGRKRAEELALEASSFNFLNDQERIQIWELFEALLKKYDLTEEKTAMDIRPLIEQGIAYHHAGMLPTLKEVIEQLFTSRLIKAIFTTETFALGINMPARSVCLDELEKFYGTGFRQLRTRDFYQMAGRAGRRGLDHEGFVYVRVNPHQITYQDVQRIIFGKPEPVQSQLNTTYATLLNLYKDLGRELITIYPETFHSFQSSSKKQGEAVDLIQSKLQLLEDLGYIMATGLTPKGQFASSIFGFELLLSEMREDGMLEKMKPEELCVLLAGLVYEPRKGAQAPRLSRNHEALEKEVRHYSAMIYKEEYQYRVHPYTRPAHFHLSGAIEAWAQGTDFDRLFRLTDTDEGELVRYFRMVIQLLRELSLNPYSSDILKATAGAARHRINRGVIDAEKQLRV
ncbi:MAG: DEAD/DEAH box helicase [Candidatus Omnitrophica bacterium]|nr:DEAD/DEAH box helicase [Candidatus Omnitrophota bacterium]